MKRGGHHGECPLQALARQLRKTAPIRKARGMHDRVDASECLARRANELKYALPKNSFYTVHAEPELFFEPRDFSRLIRDPDIIGFHISPKGRGSQQPVPGSLHAWAAERFPSTSP